MEEILKDRNLMDVVLILAYLFGIAYLVQRFRPISKNVYLLAIYIGIIHFLFTFICYFSTFTGDADSKGYYLSTSNNYLSFTDTSLANGTSSIDFFLYPFVHYFSFGYLGCFFVFSFISLIGIYKLYEILLKINGFKWANWLYLMLLPSMHYWTSSIGKDALIFFGISSLLNVYYFKRAYVKYILPIVLIGLVRFYILTFISLGVFLALIILSKKLRLGYKIALIGIFTICVIFLAPYFFQSIGFSGLDEVDEKKEIIQRANMIGGGAIDLSNANMAVKWFSYLFRPLVFEAKNAFGLAAAIENILWMVIFYMMFFGVKNKNVRSKLNSFFWICFACILTITLPASYALSNLGIASRQKIMILPFLLIIFFTLLSSNKTGTDRKDNALNES